MKSLKQFMTEAKKREPVQEQTTTEKNVKSVAAQGVKPDTSSEDLAAKVFRAWTGTNV